MPRCEMQVVVSDQHYPFADPVAEKLVLDFIKDMRPKKVHLLGDFFDLYKISRFSKDPARKETLQDELDDASEGLSRYKQAAPRAEWHFYMGNHEERLQRYLWTQAPELASLRCLNTRDLLGIDKHKIIYHDAMDTYREGKLLLTHGDIVRKKSAASAAAHQEKYGISVLHGHTHRLGTYYRTDLTTTYGAAENGCLCKTDPEYCKQPDWQQGFTTLWYHGDFFQFEQVPIVNRQIVYHGKLRKFRRAG